MYRKTLTNLRIHFRAFLQIVRVLILSNKKFDVRRRETCIFDLDNSISKRHLLPLFVYLSQSGINVYIKINRKFLSHIVDKFDYELFKLPGVRLRLFNSKRISHFLTNKSGKCHLDQKRVQISPVDRSNLEVFDYILPYSMSPKMLLAHFAHRPYADSNLFLDCPRDIKAIFIGNISSDHSSITMPHMSRSEMYNLIRNSFSENELVVIETDEQRNNASDLEGKILIINANKTGVDTCTYLNLLRRSRFFIAMPGIHYFFAHNLVEALHCLTIPIIQFPLQYFPGFTNRVNCLEFQTGAGLIELLKSEYSASQMREMRRALFALQVTDYCLASRHQRLRGLLASSKNPSRLGIQVGNYLVDQNAG